MTRLITAALVTVLISFSLAAAQAPDEVAPPEPGVVATTSRTVERLHRKLQQMQGQLAQVDQRQAVITEQRTRLEQRIAALQAALQQIEQNPALGEALGELIGGGGGRQGRDRD